MDIPKCEIEREAYYLARISDYTPPASRHDQLMLSVYRNLLRSVRELQRLEQNKGHRNIAGC